MATILQDVKEVLNVNEQNLGFDKELLMLINGIRLTLIQQGVTQLEGLVIEGETQWPTFDSSEITSAVKAFILLKMRQLFDMTANQAVAETLGRSIIELEGQLAHEIEEVNDVD